MTIGELARRVGATVKALRFYDKAGVLAPDARTESGYRLYGDAAVDRYRFVRGAQAVGLTLEEIAQIVAQRDSGRIPCALVTGLIEQRATEVEARIAELEYLRDQLRRLGTAPRWAAAADGPRRPATSSSPRTVPHPMP